MVEEKIWCEEYNDYYGNSDARYGGKLTDLRTLPTGLEFYVANGGWTGKKLDGDCILVYAPSGHRQIKLTDQHYSLYLDY